MILIIGPMILFFVIIIVAKEYYIWNFIEAFTKNVKEGYFDGLSSFTSVCLRLISGFCAILTIILTVYGIVAWFAYE